MTAPLITLHQPKRLSTGEWAAAAEIHALGGTVRVVATAPEALAARALAKVQAYATQRLHETPYAIVPASPPSALERREGEEVGRRKKKSFWQKLAGGVRKAITRNPIARGIAKSAAALIPVAGPLIVGSGAMDLGLDAADKALGKAARSKKIRKKVRRKVKRLHQRAKTGNAGAKRAVKVLRAAATARRRGGDKGVAKVRALVRATTVIQRANRGDRQAQAGLQRLVQQALAGERAASEALGYVALAGERLLPRVALPREEEAWLWQAAAQEARRRALPVDDGEGWDADGWDAEAVADGELEEGEAYDDEALDEADGIAGEDWAVSGDDDWDVDDDGDDVAGEDWAVSGDDDGSDDDWAVSGEDWAVSGEDWAVAGDPWEEPWPLDDESVGWERDHDEDFAIWQAVMGAPDVVGASQALGDDQLLALLRALRFRRHSFRRLALLARDAGKPAPARGPSRGPAPKPLKRLRPPSAAAAKKRRAKKAVAAANAALRRAGLPPMKPTGRRGRRKTKKKGGGWLGKASRGASAARAGVSKAKRGGRAARDGYGAARRLVED
ncbi:MAG: hypothetical protein R3B72_51295 [Polyangiaceae bacterium]